MIRVKRELQRVYRNGCRYNERINAETARQYSACCLLLIDKVRGKDKSYIEYLKIETRLIDEKFASVMGECVI